MIKKLLFSLSFCCMAFATSSEPCNYGKLLKLIQEENFDLFLEELGTSLEPCSDLYEVRQFVDGFLLYINETYGLSLNREMLMEASTEVVADLDLTDDEKEVTLRSIQIILSNEPVEEVVRRFSNERVAFKAKANKRMKNIPRASLSTQKEAAYIVVAMLLQATSE